MGRNIIVPILKTENVINIIESCFDKEGLNKRHSRSLKGNGYREPLNGTLTFEEMKKIDKEYTYLVLQYFAKKYYADLKSINADMSQPITKYFPEFIYNITGNDLLFIIKKNYDELKEYNKKYHSSTVLSQFLYVHFIYQESDNIRFSEEHFNSQHLYKDESLVDEEEKLHGFNPKYSKRIYLNLPRKSEVTYRFGLVYIQKCIDNKIPFDMKLLGSFSHNDKDLDGTILYTKNAYFDSQLKILEEILDEYPEFKQYIGSPIYTGGNIVYNDGKSYMAVSHAGNSYYCEEKKMMGKTYNDVVDIIINFSYIYACCKIIKYYFAYFVNKLDQETVSIINLILKNQINFDMLDKLLLIEKVVRKKVYDFYNQKYGNDKRNVLNNLILFTTEKLPEFSSYVNFGDLKHLDIPIYKDNNFLLFEENKSKGR